MPTPVNQEYRAFLGWNILTECAREHKTLTYGELGRFVGVHHRVTRFFLALIQEYCLSHRLPPLTILVVNQTGLPGDGFIARNINQFDEGKDEVYNYRWENIENPFGFAVVGSVENQIIDELVTNPASARDVYGRIKVRGIAQSVFRQALLKVYGSACAVCGLTFEVALDAAHIVPWSDCDEGDRLNVRNGILLCTVHHKLFDAGAFVLSDNYTLVVNNHHAECPVISDSDRRQLSEFDGKQLRLPSEQHNQPERRFIQVHRNQFNAG